jgi:hypothetical protein
MIRTCVIGYRLQVRTERTVDFDCNSSAPRLSFREQSLDDAV